MLFLCLIYILTLLLYFSLGVGQHQYVNISQKILLSFFTCGRWQEKGKRIQIEKGGKKQQNDSKRNQDSESNKISQMMMSLLSPQNKLVLIILSLIQNYDVQRQPTFIWQHPNGKLSTSWELHFIDLNTGPSQNLRSHLSARSNCWCGHPRRWQNQWGHLHIEEERWLDSPGSL